MFLMYFFSKEQLKIKSENKNKIFSFPFTKLGLFLLQLLFLVRYEKYNCQVWQSNQIKLCYGFQKTLQLHGGLKHELHQLQELHQWQSISTGCPTSF